MVCLNFTQMFDLDLCNLFTFRFGKHLDKYIETFIYKKCKMQIIRNLVLTETVSFSIIKKFNK